MQAMKRNSSCYLFLFVSILSQLALTQRALSQQELTQQQSLPQQPVVQNGSIVAGFSGGTGLSAKKEQIHWAPNLATALKAAQRLNVPVMVHLYGDSCLRCRIVEERVLSKPELIQTLNRFFICVKINGSQNPQIMQQFGAHNYPTEVFLASDGSILYQDNPPDNVKSYEQRLTSVAFANRDRNAMLAAQNPAAKGLIAANSKKQNASSVTSGQAVGSLVSQANSRLAANEPTVEKSTTDTGNVVFSAAASSIQMQDKNRPKRIGQLAPSHAPGSEHQLAAAVGPMGGQAATASWNRPQASTSDAQQGKRAKISANTVVHPSVSPGARVMHNVATTSQPNMLARTGSRFGSTTAAEGPQTISNPYVGSNANVASKPRGIPAITVSSTQTVINPNSAIKSSKAVVSQTPIATEPEAPAFLDGYCPVALSQEGKWTEGSSEYRVKHRGRIYHLSSQQAMMRFLATPDTLSPVLSGYDPLILLEEGRLVEGSTQHALHMKETGSCLLFSSAETKRKYWNTEDEFQRYSRALAALIEKIKRMK
ncbi:MAG: thioredoxin family protein [Planctomycetota bacterium]|nr:thioredoxin family protein [Planctomycetota bacterium]